MYIIRPAIMHFCLAYMHAHVHVYMMYVYMYIDVRRCATQMRSEKRPKRRAPKP